MKASIHIGAFSYHLSLAQCIQLAAQTGYDCIELSLNEDFPLSLSCTDAELAACRQAALDAGITITSVASGLYWQASFTSDDPQKRKKAMDIARKQIDVAQKLGADAVLIVPGAVYIPFMPNSEVIPYDVAYARAFSAMQELSRYAEEKQVVVGIENVWNGFLLSPLEMRDFIDKIGSDYIKVYLDVGNLLPTGYPQQWIRILGKRITRIHVKDYHRADGTLNGFCELLEGDVPYEAVMAALRETGYTGPLTAEIPYTEGAVQRTYDALVKILAM